MFMLLLIALLSWWLWTSYNRLVSLREVCRAAQGNIQAQLARRYDLYLKAASVLSQGSDFERGVFQQVTELRTRNAPIQEKIAELGRIFAVAEANPNVHSVNLYGNMQQAVFETETKIQMARETYNHEAGVYNIVIRQLPMNIAAWILRFDSLPYFEHTEVASV